MTQTHAMYPLVTKVALGIAKEVSKATNRDQSEQTTLDLLDSILGAEGYYANDLKNLEEWLGTLTADQLEIFENGEPDELYTLVGSSPLCESFPNRTGSIFEDFEAAYCDVLIR